MIRAILARRYGPTLLVAAFVAVVWSLWVGQLWPIAALVIGTTVFVIATIEWTGKAHIREHFRRFMQWMKDNEVSR